MGNVLVINTTSFETRVALVEDGTISEYYAERKREKGIVGNIYKGRVLRVLPGMQAAFVDLGTDKAGFLYVNDVWYDPSFSDEAYDLTEGEWGFGAGLPDEESAELEAVYSREQEVLESRRYEEARDGSGISSEESSLDQPDGPTASEQEGGRTDGMNEGAAPLAEGCGQTGDVEALPRGERTESMVAGAAASVRECTEDVAKEDAADTAGSKEQESEEGSGEDAADTAGSKEQESEEGAGEERADAAGSKEQESEEGSGEDAADAAGSKEQESEEEAGEEEVEQDEADDEEEPTAEAGELPEAAKRGRRRTKRRGRTHQRSERTLEARKERTRRPVKRAEIQDLLKEDDEIVVQVAKAPIGSKGARITTHVSLPGRHLVFMPTVDHVGISRRIASDKERRRLRQIIEEIRPPGTGFIVRTVADGVDRGKLVADARFLLNLWADMNKRKERISAPALLHPDLDLILRATRDLFGEEVERLVIDDEQEYDRLLKFMEVHMPALKDKVEHYKGKEPIFDAYGIEDELRRAQQRRVWLKSGGYLIIDQAEALAAIDVNSGRYIGKKNLEETITKINIEAAEEVVYQLRLRNMGGIIILDFIDMEKASNREKVYRALDEALRKDKAKTNILKISELGLVEMTRKRVRESLTRMMNEPCPYCDGRGMMRTGVTVAYEVLRDAMREAAHRKEDTLFVNCSPEVAALLTTVERDALRYTMEKCKKKLVMKAQEGYHREQYDLYAKNTETGTSVALGEATGSAGASRSGPSHASADQGSSHRAGAAAANGGGGSAPAANPASRRRRRRRGRGKRDGGRGDADSSQGAGRGQGQPREGEPRQATSAKAASPSTGGGSDGE